MLSELTKEDPKASDVWYNLAVCYLNGMGVDIDRVKSQECFRKAAALGLADAAEAATQLDSDIADYKKAEQFITQKLKANAVTAAATAATAATATTAAADKKAGADSKATSTADAGADAK
jgi:TPR repeat protein